MRAHVAHSNPMFSHPQVAVDSAVGFGVGVWATTKRTRIRAGGLSRQEAMSRK